jgi:phosphoglycolate phosphatase
VQDPSSINAVLFDLDGTLIDGFPGIAASVNHVRSLYGLPPLTVAEVTKHVGRGPVYLLNATVGQGDIDANVAAYRQHHPSVLRAGTRLMLGARETLLALKQTGRKLGICSNKPVAFTRELIGWLDVADLLDVVLGPEDVARNKPAPDMLLLALSRLGIPPEQALYIGDMTVDIATARAAGVSVWVVATGSDTAESLDRAVPDRRLNSLTEIPGLLESRGSSGPPD